MEISTDETIQTLFSSRTLKIKALTSAGIISGIVTDIMKNSSCSSKKDNFLDKLLEQASSEPIITIRQSNLIYVIEEARLYPISNLKDYVFLDRIELNSSKIIALCPLFEEVD